MTNRVGLKKPAEFRRVYERGVRYDGLSLTALVAPNGLSEHRFGVTVSRKFSRSAVKRNRAKRLLRESFRKNAASLNCLKAAYDWVLLPRRVLAEAKLDLPLSDLNLIIQRVAAAEALSGK